MFPSLVRLLSRIKLCGKVSHQSLPTHHNRFCDIQKTAYYNAGSAAVILVLIFIGIGIFLWCRVRRNRVKLPEARIQEEAIPLTEHHGQAGDDDGSDAYLPRLDTRGKGKGKAIEAENGYTQELGEPVFEVGDSDDEETGRYSNHER